ncbi:MAG: hypothetical protein LBU88_04825 [Treponema sp.]|nr:hypothetical protein [Treponema sp.]
MFRRISLISLILTAALVMILGVSCQKKENRPASQTDAFGAIEGVSGKWNMGFVLRVNTGLYSIGEDTGSETDKFKWIASLNLGDSIMVGEARRATFERDGAVYDLFEVRDNNNREGYIINTQVAVGGSLAVVVDDRANLFRTSNAIDVMGSMISRKTVLVYYPESNNNGYVEIRAYDPEARANRHGNFVRLTSLSLRASDIQSSILLQTALPLRTTVASENNRRGALLETALFDYADSVFYSEIYEVFNPAPSIEEPDIYIDSDE